MPESRSAGGIAEGTIRPGRFVKVGTVEGGVLECDANQKVLGVSFRETRRSDYVDTSGDAAHTGEPISYYTAGARCWIVAGGTIAVDDYLEADTDGLAVATTTNLHFIGGRALSAGVSGDWVRIEVLPPMQVSS